MSVFTPPPERRVDWREVIGGILLALFVGFFVVLGGFFAGLYVADATKSGFLGGASGFLAPAVMFIPAYLLLRRRMPDLARGILIGACVVIIVGGGCNALLVGSMASGFR